MDAYPDRKIGTFTQIRIINRMMLLWPALYGGIIYLTCPRDLSNDNKRREFNKNLKLNVIVQIIMVYLMYYTIYYTTELMKHAVGSDVISGHIYTGILACSSFISTTIFMHKYRDPSSPFYKI